MKSNFLNIRISYRITLKIISTKINTFRGTGRVTRDIIKNLEFRGKNNTLECRGRSFFFFSSVDTINKNFREFNKSIVIVHDITPLILYKKFGLKKIKQ
jgi:hypothetical protein